MTKYAQGAVLVLPFPYSDQLAEKRRPAVVVSKPALQNIHGLIWVAVITSDRGPRRVDDVPISGLQKAGLPTASVVRCTKLATIEPARVLRSAGVLSRADMTAVLSVVRKYV